MCSNELGGRWFLISWLKAKVGARYAIGLPLRWVSVLFTLLKIQDPLGGRPMVPYNHIPSVYVFLYYEDDGSLVEYRLE